MFSRVATNTAPKTFLGHIMEMRNTFFIPLFHKTPLINPPPPTGLITKNITLVSVLLNGSINPRQQDIQGPE